MRQLADLPRKVQGAVAKKIDLLVEVPRLRKSEKLEAGDDLYRIRAGDYRVVYQIDDDVLTILIVRVGHGIVAFGCARG